MVKPFRDQLLAGSALADHEHGPVKRRGAARALDGVEKREALPDELFGPLHARLLVANPTIWQGFSLSKLPQKGEIRQTLRFP